MRWPRLWWDGPSAFSCQALAECLRQNSALMNLNLGYNLMDSEAAKAWCLVRMVWRRGKRAAGFHRKEQDTATWKWSQWNAQRTWKQCTMYFTVSLLMSNERQVRRNIVLQCFPGWGTSKGRYIGPQMCYMRTFVHLLTLGHILNQSCRSVS